MDKINESPALRAARVIFASRARRHLRRGDQPTTPSTPTVTISSMARKYDCSRTAISKHLKGLEQGHVYGALSPQGAGRPRALTDAEDAAVVAYIQWLERCGCPAQPASIVTAANELRQSRVPPAAAVNKNWLSRWMIDHPELQRARSIRPREVSRASVEADPTAIVEFFDKYDEYMQTYDLRPSAIWNMDEAGCRIGCLHGRLQVVVTRVGCRQTPV